MGKKGTGARRRERIADLDESRELIGQIQPLLDQLGAVRLTGDDHQAYMNLRGQGYRLVEALNSVAYEAWDRPLIGHVPIALTEDDISPESSRVHVTFSVDDDGFGLADETIERLDPELRKGGLYVDTVNFERGPGWTID